MPPCYLTLTDQIILRVFDYIDRLFQIIAQETFT